MLIGEDDVVLWSDASDSPVARPASRARGEATRARSDRTVESSDPPTDGRPARPRAEETTAAARAPARGCDTAHARHTALLRCRGRVGGMGGGSALASVAFFAVRPSRRVDAPRSRL